MRVPQVGQDNPSEPPTRLPQCRFPHAWQNVRCMASQWQAGGPSPTCIPKIFGLVKISESQNIAETSGTVGLGDMALHLRFATALLSERRRCRSGGPPVDANPFGKTYEVSPVAKLISVFSDNIIIICIIHIYIYIYAHE